MYKKQIVYIDMDGVLVDLESEMNLWFGNNPTQKQMYVENPDLIPGLFRNPPPIKGAIEAVKQLELSGKYELIIATTAPWNNPGAATDKRYWIERHFGGLFHKQMIITHRKDLLVGDYIIDDRTANGVEKFDGEHLHFGWSYENQKWNEYRDWKSILKKLL